MGGLLSNFIGSKYSGPKVFSLSSDLSEDEIISHLLSESNDEDLNDEKDSDEGDDHQSEDVR